MNELNPLDLDRIEALVAKFDPAKDDRLLAYRPMLDDDLWQFVLNEARHARRTAVTRGFASLAIARFLERAGIAPRGQTQDLALTALGLINDVYVDPRPPREAREARWREVEAAVGIDPDELRTALRDEVLSAVDEGEVRERGERLTPSPEPLWEAVMALAFEAEDESLVEAESTMNLEPDSSVTRRARELAVRLMTSRLELGNDRSTAEKWMEEALQELRVNVTDDPVMATHCFLALSKITALAVVAAAHFVNLDPHTYLGALVTSLPEDEDDL